MVQSFKSEEPMFLKREELSDDLQERTIRRFILYETFSCW